MAIPLSPLLDRETYSPWPNLCAVGLSLAEHCAQAGFLDWASNLPQLRHLEAKDRRTANKRTAPSPPQSRRVPAHVRRLFIWGFISANAAISIAWAYAADEASTARAVVAGPNTMRLAIGGWRPLISVRDRVLSRVVEHLALSAQHLGRGRWWTLVTYALSHCAPAHLIGNMSGFYVWASRCFDLGLGPASVAGLMLGSAVCCGLAGVASESALRPSLHMGASGVVYGLSEWSYFSPHVMNWSPFFLSLAFCAATVLCMVVKHAPPVGVRPD